MKFLILCIFIPFYVHAHEAGETQAQIGPGKAVEAYDKHTGIKLSAKALKALQVETMKVTSADPVVPQSAVLMIQSKTALFALRNGWFKRIEVKASRDGGTYKITSKEIKPGDQIVVRGAPLLRVAEMNVSDVDEEHEDKDEEHKEHKEDDDHHHDEEKSEHEGEHK